MIEFLNNNSALITLFFTIVVGISTLVYALLTYFLVTETRKMRRAQTDPHIFVYLAHSEHSISFINLEVKNIGLGPAYDVKFTVSKDFDMHRNRKFSEIGFIKNGIKYFAPNQSFQQFIASFIDHKNNLESKTIELNVTYKNAAGNSFNDNIQLSFAQFKSITQLGGSPPIYKISKELEKLTSYFNQIVNGFKRLNVDLFTSEDRAIEEKEIEDFRNSMEENKDDKS